MGKNALVGLIGFWTLFAFSASIAAHAESKVKAGVYCDIGGSLHGLVMDRQGGNGERRPKNPNIQMLRFGRTARDGTVLYGTSYRYGKVFRMDIAEFME